MAGAEEIIEDYAASLEWLQTNDRYAINNFTVIAKENTEHADAISTVLTDHITKAHPIHKLPALYVLDSIAKNIGTPYTLFLGHRLYATFMGAYSLVDHGVRKKLDEMLKTWKQPVPGSLDLRPVFDPSITKRIENALIQVKTRTLQVEQQQQREQQDLLRRRTPSAIPPAQWRNTPTQTHNGAGAEQWQLRDQQDLLRRLASSVPQGQWRNTPTPPQSGAEFLQRQQQQQQRQEFPQRQAPSPPYTQWQSQPEQLQGDTQLKFPAPSSQGFVSYQPTPAPSNPPLADLAALLRSSLVERPAIVHESALAPLRPPLADRSCNIELTSASLKINRPHLVDKLYKQHPNQCLTCGRRFQDTTEGKSNKARHMDWHFRTNQRLIYDAQRGQSRSWYVDELEWIKFRDGEEDLRDAVGQELVHSASTATMPSNEPRNKFIPVPSENEMPCGICQDKFAPSWNEQLQDFVWMDAVRIGNKVYHATCYADFQKDDGRGTFRAGTPDSILGKRKAKANVESLPPAKKSVNEA